MKWTHGQPESAFLADVLSAVASRPTLFAYHSFDSRLDTGGFPDLVIAGPGGVIFRELKIPRGSLSPTQTDWKYALLAAGADYDVWLPSHLPGLISRTLDKLAGYDH